MIASTHGYERYAAWCAAGFLVIDAVIRLLVHFLAELELAIVVLHGSAAIALLLFGKAVREVVVAVVLLVLPVLYLMTRLAHSFGPNPTQELNYFVQYVMLCIPLLMILFGRSTRRRIVIATCLFVVGYSGAVVLGMLGLLRYIRG